MEVEERKQAEAPEVQPEPISRQFDEKYAVSVKQPSLKKSKKKKVLRPIKEEIGRPFVSQHAYLCVFQRVRDDLKLMNIGPEEEGDHLKSPEVLGRVLNMIADLD